MPFRSGWSRETVARNIEEMIRAGHAQPHAVAASMARARRDYFRVYPNDELPPWLQFPKGYTVRGDYLPSGEPIIARRSKRFAVNPESRDERDAKKLYHDFTGHRVTWKKRVRVPAPRTGLAIGPVLGIMYETVRDGVREQYLHKFRPSSRPHLAISSDGKTALLLGGAWRFTDRGFVDE